MEPKYVASVPSPDGDTNVVLTGVYPGGDYYTAGWLPDVANCTDNFANHVLVMNLDGSTLWMQPIWGQINAGLPGCIYVLRNSAVASENYLQSLDLNGNQNWLLPLDFAPKEGVYLLAKPARNGGIFLEATDVYNVAPPVTTVLAQVTESGELAWALPFVQHLVPWIAFEHPAGFVVLQYGPDGNLVAVSTSGKQLWEYVSDPDGYFGGCALGPDGLIHVSEIWADSGNFELIRLTADGKVFSKSEHDIIIESSMCIGNDGTITMARGKLPLEYDGQVLSLDPDGYIRWATSEGPIADANSAGLITDLAGNIYWADLCLDPDGFLRWEGLYALQLDSNGRMLVCTEIWGDSAD